jgi:hypothetical protein
MKLRLFCAYCLGWSRSSWFDERGEEERVFIDSKLPGTGRAVGSNNIMLQFFLAASLINISPSVSSLASATFHSLALRSLPTCCFSTFFSKTYWVTVLPFFYSITYPSSQELGSCHHVYLSEDWCLYFLACSASSC